MNNDYITDLKKCIDDSEMVFVGIGNELQVKLSSLNEMDSFHDKFQLLEKNEEYILLMDEPEISMHFEWQRKLISNIISLNPNCQIILTSHSPAIIMDGWEQFVLSMDDIRTKIK